MKLIALDLDGTLTNDRKEITPETMKSLMEAQEKGVRLVLASARPVPGLYKIRDLLDLKRYGGILMAYNGGCMIDAATGGRLFETSIDLQTAKGILRFLEDLPVTVILDDGEQFYVKDAAGYKVEYECWNNQMTCTEVENLAEFLTFPPVKMLLSVLPEQIMEVQEQIAAHLPEELTVMRTAPFYLEIIPKAINKGQAITEICRILNIPREETAAFGDAENDIPMILAAGCGVAMGNAEEAVKEAADLVTLSNNEDGVAAALKKIM